jgi:3-hydroxybutyryl-CoA dehydratase
MRVLVAPAFGPVPDPYLVVVAPQRESCLSAAPRRQGPRRAWVGEPSMSVVTRKTYAFEDLQVGMEASYARAVTEADIVQFAELSGDKNPVHLDEGYAAKTMFKGRIAHGMLTAGYISTVFGMELPGPGCIYISQTLNFRGPVRIGDKVIAKVKIVELYPSKRRARFDCVCLVDGKSVLEGEAILMVPGRGA